MPADGDGKVITDFFYFDSDSNRAYAYSVDSRSSPPDGTTTTPAAAMVTLPWRATIPMAAWTQPSAAVAK
jgi:hypothetical protein